MCLRKVEVIKGAVTIIRLFNNKRDSSIAINKDRINY